MSAYLSGLFSLAGRVGLVTGASSGIGRHMALVLARAGADVVLVGRRAGRLRETAASLDRDGDARAAVLCADLSARGEVERVAAEASEAFGPPDIVINAAGTNLREPPDDITWDSWGRTLDLNLSVPFFLSRAMVPAMREKGRGNIVNIASLQSFRAFTNGIPYGASKGGIAQLTRAMAEAWSPDGITVNAVAPGFFPTELTKPVYDDPDALAHNAAMTAVGRNGELADLDGITVFLASGASAYVTGQVIAVDGGYTAK